MHITLRQAATYLDVSEPVLRRWIRERQLPVHRFNERFYLNAIELWEWATEQRIPVSRGLLDEARRTDQPVPSLEELLLTGGIHYDVPGTDKTDVMREVVARLPLPPEFDRDFLLTVLEAREKLGSTAVGDGIAIPHVRHPILLHTPHALVALCLLRTAIEFGATDRRPVHTIFTVVSPNAPTHLRILAQLAFALRDETLRELLRDRAPAEALLTRINLVEKRTTGYYRAVKEDEA